MFRYNVWSIILVSPLYRPYCNLYAYSVQRQHVTESGKFVTEATKKIPSRQQEATQYPHKLHSSSSLSVLSAADG